MKYIESLELREWVKDSLKKTIFQKAHALAVQTGCEILVKLHDTTDITGCQYYATQNLRRLYRNSKLRQEGESLVSGETGSPLTDKCIQYEEEPTEGTDDVTPDDDGGGGGMNEDFGNNAVPMQITAHTSMASETQTTQSDVHITQVTNQRFSSPVQVKQEPDLTQQYTHSPMMQSMQTDASSQGQGLGAFSYPISPKPYQCSICRKAFKSVHVLQKHTMTFHMPSGAGSMRSRGKGRGTRGSSRARGRGRGTTFSRPTLVQQPFHSPPMPATTIKPEDDQNRFTCIMCNQNFEQSSQLNEHMSQCPMAPGASQGAQSDPSTDQFASPSAAESEDQPGFSGDFSQEVPPTTSAAPNWSFPPPDGAPPSGVPVSGAGQYFGQQSPSFGSPTQSPRSSGQGTSRGPKTTYHIRGGGPNFGASTAMTKHNIMSAILKVKGPAVTHRVVNCSYTFLRMLTAKQFMTVAAELESIGLGTIVSLKSAGRPTFLFMKHPPEDVIGILEANPDLCSPGYYASRYELPISKIMSPSVREALRSTGLIEQISRPIDFSNRTGSGHNKVQDK
ncbi:uncharacterized protein [Amphiura filiformis]|uniref:uncharacterized protein isoform X2 n=1 Tax=Amphiura filiformis TaxID=82378 RepID=UPI003B211033